MPLDITLTIDKKIPKRNYETLLSFSDDADYWYLYGTMITEIRHETEQMLDLYANCKFSGQNLHQLLLIVQKHIEILKKKNEKSWSVHTGTQFKPVKKEIYKTLIKTDLQEKLNKFVVVIKMAIEKNEMVVGFGD